MNNKEFEPLKIVPDVQLIAEMQKEYTLKRREMVRPGLTLFAVYPLDNYRAEKVDIKKQARLTTDGKVQTQNRANYDPEAIYEWAINAKRASYKVERDIKKFIKRFRAQVEWDKTHKKQ